MAGREPLLLEDRCLCTGDRQTNADRIQQRSSQDDFVATLRTPRHRFPQPPHDRTQPILVQVLVRHRPHKSQSPRVSSRDLSCGHFCSIHPCRSPGWYIVRHTTHFTFGGFMASSTPDMRAAPHSPPMSAPTCPDFPKGLNTSSSCYDTLTPSMPASAFFAAGDSSLRVLSVRVASARALSFSLSGRST